jgi:tRNA-splicing ligase RtcB
MQVIKEEGSAPIKAWVATKAEIRGGDRCVEPDIEDSALKQLKNLARLPFLAPNGIAVMPDVHAGIGATVGSVIATVDAIIPAAVGVDIGCGMNAVRLSLKASDLPDSLAYIRSKIEAAVPVGFARHDLPKARALYDASPVMTGHIPDAAGTLISDYYKTASQLGTLGGGNHFIELCIDENQDVWIMLHSGSRGIGNQIGREFIDLAKEEMERWHIKLPDNDLAYLPEDTEVFKDYVESVEWAQAYALENRATMMRAVVDVLRSCIEKPFELTSEAINCHHNYISRESHFGKNLWITRKGAIRAREGDLGIIPGSMGQRSYIVRGKGNPESYCSCSHGAGRVMSRTEAKRRFSLTDLIAQTEGVECRKDAGVIDEIPGAYKLIDEVMANQRDLVEVVHTLKQVLCIKG